MRPLTIYLSDLTYTTLSLATDAFPLNVGYLAANANKDFGSEVDIKIFKYLDDLEDAINNKAPDILGMSNYPWNFDAGRVFLKKIQQINPEAIRIMGGPNFPINHKLMQKQFLKGNSYLDYYCYLEGEQAFNNLVERILSVGLDRKKIKETPIGGMLNILEDGTLVKGIELIRRKELDEIPSPYTSGYMDKFFDGKLAPMLETNRGCPFSCTFCHEGNTDISKVNFFSVDRILEDLDYIAKRIPKEVTNLMFADPNFGMYTSDTAICRAIAKFQAKQNWPRSIFASTGKNKKERIAENLKILNGTMMMWMSVQSMDPTVQKLIKRDNIKIDAMMVLVDVYRQMGLPTKSEIILGLPGDNYERHMGSIASIVDAGIDFVNTYTLMLLNGTELKSPEEIKRFKIGTHFRVLPRDFGKLKSGEICVEIEEVITSTCDLPHEDYIKMRLLHFIVSVVYNGHGFWPLFKFFRLKEIPIFDLLKLLLENYRTAPNKIQEMFKSFEWHTKNELFDSYDECYDFFTDNENYEKLTSEDLGINVIQTHHAKSLKNMDDWTGYVFDQADKLLLPKLTDDEMFMYEDVKNYARGRVHNIWGYNRNDDCPEFNFRYDIGTWMRDKAEVPLEKFKLNELEHIRFAFPEDKQFEMQSMLDRYGTSDSGIGRIMISMGPTRAWREPIKVV
jgi:radical SAM superfamily enzyme YgiQ (UPF0313 family)